jgi:hypothetical protein
MVAGPLHPDVTIAQCCVKHPLQLILHLPQPLLGTVCTSGHQSQAHQDTCKERYGLHGLSNLVLTRVTELILHRHIHGENRPYPATVPWHED